MKKNLAETHPQLAAQWHPALNRDLTPQQVSHGSTFKVWWLGECGHEWQAVIGDRVRARNCPYCANKRVLTGYNDLATTHPQLAAQWHPDKNGEISPETITSGTHKKVWWLGECNHEWQALTYNRAKGSNCPLCKNKRVQGESNDLATTHPQLAAQWHPTKNGDLTPSMVTSGSRKKVWWQCPKGHDLERSVSSRVNRQFHYCSYCNNNEKIKRKQNDLFAAFPELAQQWHPTKNLDLKDLKKVWWLCEKGHEWRTVVNGRTRLDGKATGCPYCRGNKVLAGFNDLASQYPDVAIFWHPTRNTNFTAEMATVGSGKKVWWLGKCGHEWDSTINNRVRLGSGCPYCSGHQNLVGYNDLASTHPDVAQQWHPTKNGELTPQMVTHGSDCRVWWLGECRHEWQAKVSDRTRLDGKATGCPTCAASTKVSRGEQEIADYLQNSLGLVIEQSNRKLLRGTELDIYVPEKQLAIEYNGVYWHSSAMQSDPKYHLKKYEQARTAGVQLLQVWEDEWRDKPVLVKRLLAHKLGVSREPLVGARSTLVEETTLSESREFLGEYHIQGHTNGSHYLGLRSKRTNQLIAVMVLVKRASTQGLTLEISRYATSCRVPGGFTKLLSHVERVLFPSRIVTFADHCISDGGLYAQNGFTAEKELKPDYRYLINKQRAHKFGYRLERFRTDPQLLWEPELTETQLAALNGLHRIYDAGKTRWVKTPLD